MMQSTHESKERDGGDAETSEERKNRGHRAESQCCVNMKNPNCERASRERTSMR